MTETSQRQLGESDSPIEDELEEAFTRMVDEGSRRLHRTWREVLVTGFFGGTEGFLVPVTTVAAKRASVAQLLKLWSGTLLANLVGGWVITWLIMAALPKLHVQTVESASHFVTAALSLQSMALAVPGTVAAAVAGAFLLAGLQLFHSILDSLLIFGALATGDAPFGYLDWLG